MNVITTIAVGAYPGAVAISPDGSHLYVTNINDAVTSSSVSVISTTSNKVIATIPLENIAQGAVVSPDGSKLFATVAGLTTDAGNLVIINTQTNLIENTVPINSPSFGISISADGSDVYVMDVNAGEAKTINTVSNEITNTVKVGKYPNSIGNFVSSGIGCSNTPIVYTITVNPAKLPPVEVPNVFTPNNDGINDKWAIRYIENYTQCKVNVFSRTGAVVYNSVGYRDAWDGKLNGQELPVGTYYYLIDLKDGNKPLSGSLTLIR